MVRSLTIRWLALLVGTLASAVTVSGAIKVENLRCEYSKDPLGIDTVHPRLSWTLSSGERGQTQGAYQILAASSPGVLARNQGDLWDTGRVSSDSTILIPYAGKPLSSGMRCYWKVRIWNQNRVASQWSSPAMWSMGLLRPEDWQARWIASSPAPTNSGAGNSSQALPLFRKTFILNKKVKQASISICGLGAYELTLNGRKVGDRALDPVWSNYRKTCYYATYDVTELLAGGKNALGVTLGNGMYNVTGGRYVKFKGSFGAPKLICQLRVDHTDGTSSVIASDDSWKTASSPILFSCIYGGEDYDARQEISGWNLPAFDDASWRAAAVVTGPGGSLVSEAMPPIKVMQQFKTVKISQPKTGVYVYDLGQNFSGWPQLTVRGPVGATVKMIPGELLNEQGLVSQRSSGGPVWFSYTLKGLGNESWHPRFSYYGFRYVQVEGAVPSSLASGTDQPLVLDLSGQFIHCSAETAGSFACSNPTINRIHDLIKAAILSNFQSVLTDCPHREKLGWLEVSHLLAGGIMYNYDVAGFYAKIVNDMREAQTPEGLVPDIAPEYTVFSAGFRDSPEWGSAYIIAPWLVYQMYGDSQVLASHYEGMQKYAAYLGGKAKEHIVSHGLGDWYDIGPKPPGESQLTSKGVTATAFYYYDLEILRQAASLLGRDDDARKYADMAQKVRASFNRQFYHSDTHQYDRNSQTANAMPLVLGLVEEDQRAAVLENLVRDVRNRDNRVTAGDVGFVFLVRALSDSGRGGVLYDLVTQTNGPGYAYQLAKGATTLTEAWDTNPNSSQNHCMLGHAEEWFYRGLGGICLDPSGPGFKKIVIRPQVTGDVKWTRASYQSAHGRIETDWKLKDDKLECNILIPANTTATVYVPTKNVQSVTESGKPANTAKGVRFLSYEKGAAVYEVVSGQYAFRSEMISAGNR